MCPRGNPETAEPRSHTGGQGGSFSSKVSTWFTKAVLSSHPPLLPAQVSLQMNFNFRPRRAGIMSLEPAAWRWGAGRRATTQQRERGFEFQRQPGPSATVLGCAECVRLGCVCSRARLRAWRVCMLRWGAVMSEVVGESWRGL